MTLPVYLDGREAGRLSLAGEGLYTRVSADCDAREGLSRLWLHGGGGSLYLGLLAPEAGRLRLTRRFSRAELAALPGPLDCARDTPAVPAASPAPAAPPDEPEDAEEGLLWFSRPDGSLTARDGQGRYLALPATLSPADPAADRLRRIGGQDYLVFRR